MRRILWLCAWTALAAEPGWWTKEPLRWLQNNLREPDGAADPKRVVEEAARFGANVLHINAGGIVAFYPTRMEYHYPSPYMKGDLLGEVVKLAHGRGIRVVARFDLSKTPQPVYDAHPEWFFRMANGEPVVFSGLYSTCINGDWYRGHAMKILAEALERYELDGLFFNMFGNQATDYAGRQVGHCHCDACRTRFRARYGRDLPAQPDGDYRQFLFDSSREVAAAIGRLIKTKRPQAGFFNYMLEHTDGVMSESNTAIGRALPLWPYASSDNVNRARNSEPGKAAVNLNMQFVDYAWRWATVMPAEIRLRLWQNVAHGGAAAFAVNGTMDQPDPAAIEAARPVFGWLKENERFYARAESAARVLLLHAPARGGAAFSQNSYRGMFRLLSEEHVPFAVAQNLDWLGKREFDLVIATDWAPPELANYKGPALVASARPPAFVKTATVETRPDVRGYLRVRDAGRFPSLGATKLLMLNGAFTVSEGASPLTLVPPSIIGPPEKIHTDMRDTEIPGLVELDGGRVAWLPWDLGGMYYRFSLASHGSLFRDLVNAMLGAKRQLETDAHPLVEFSLMRQDGQTRVHMVNGSGHSSTAYFAPLAMRGIRVSVAGDFATAEALRGGGKLRVERRGGRTSFVAPILEEYELIVLR
jgi:hypothetical protein